MNKSRPAASDTSSPFQGNQLPVAQLKPSHDLAIDADEVQVQALAVIPAYASMAEGDGLAFTWQGYVEGVPTQWKRDLTVSAGQLGRPLQIGIPVSQVLIVDGGYAEVSYRLTPGQGGPTQDSPVQTFRIEPPVAARLVPPTLVGHVAGEPMDPADFPEGVVLRLIAYSGMQVDDHVVLYGDGMNSAGSFVDSVRIDASHLQNGSVEFKVGPQWLTANDGAALVLSYQFARHGAGLSSEALVVDIRKAEPLPPPIVERAIAEGDPGAYHGYLLAQHAINGVFIRVPETVPLAAGDRLVMHWQGHPAGGQYVAPDPVSDQQARRFFIPASAVPANMGPGETKRFGVFFRLAPAVGKTRDSVPFGLRVVPLDQARYPTIQWDRLGGGASLSLQNVPADGEPLRLDSWPFMAQGQLVSLVAQGVGVTGAPARVVVRDELPVTEQEQSAGKATSRVTKAFLSGLKLHEYITLTASVSFDGGETNMPLPGNSGVRLIP